MILVALTVSGALYVNRMGSASQNPSQEKTTDPGKKDGATAGSSKPLPVVKVETVRAATLSKTMALTGSVAPSRTARMASPAEGPVEVCETQNCMVREGDRVTQGQVLMQIGRKKAAEAQLAAARQVLNEQEAEFRRLEQLVRAGAIPGSELDAARSRCETARAELTKIRESNEDYVVKAPWDGVVFRVHVTEGDYVAPRMPLIEIFDPESLVVKLAVPEAQSTEVNEGTPVRVQLDAHVGGTFTGKISRVYPQLDERMRTRTVEAALDDPVDLIPGMFARVEVILARYPDAVTVPAEALRVNAAGEKTVFVLHNGKALGRKVQTGIEEAGRVQITTGVQAGDRVVVAGNETLTDGAAVKAQGEKTP